MAHAFSGCLAGAAFMLLAACSGQSPQLTGSTTSGDSLFTLQPAADRQALQRTPGASPYLARLLDDPASEDVRLVDVSPALVSADTRTLSVPLPDGRQVPFRLLRINDSHSGMTGWIGDVASDRKQRFASTSEVEMDPFNWISLLRNGDHVVGSIRVDGQSYRLEPAGGGQHVLVKVDESRLPPDGEPLQVPDDQGTPARTALRPAATSGKSVIRVLLVSSQEVRDNNPAYRTNYTQSVQNANMYMQNSQVGITYEIAGFLDSSFSDARGGSTYDMLLAMGSSTHPLGIEVQRERDRLRADLVSLAVDNSTDGICGIAWTTATKELGLSVVKCWVAWAHELGHNLGVIHGWVPGDPISSPPYIHGYRHSVSPVFHTVMTTSHGAIPYFSNPRLTYQGVPIGTVEHNDASRRFDERRIEVENFYPPQLTLTLYSGTAFSGRSCSQTLERGNSAAPCGSVGRDVRSVKVQGFEGGRLCLRATVGNPAYSCFSGDFRGDFQITDIDNASGLPGAIRLDRGTQSPLKGLTNRVEYN